MKREQFINTAIRIANDTPTRYQLGGWGQQDGNTYLFDCVCLIKSILWGFNFEKGGHGGAVYCSNDVPDLNADGFFSQCCYDKSNNFNNIEVGELVWMNGHIGTYIGNGKVAEATSAWEAKVVISNIGKNGERTRNGKRVYTWLQHGKCQFIDYSKPEPEPQKFKYNIGDKVILNGHLYATANGEGQGKLMQNSICTIALRHEGSKPYNVDLGNGNYDGWVAEYNLTPYVEPKKEITIGTKVRTIGLGKENSYGKGRNAKKGLVGTITNIKEGRPYPYLVNQDGWYKKEDLEIM